MAEYERRYRPYIAAFGKTLAPGSVDDLIQNVLIQVRVSAQGFDGRSEDSKAWLGAIIRSQLSRFVRQLRRDAACALPDDLESQPMIVIDESRLKTFYDWMGREPEIDQQIVRLKREGKTSEQIAETIEQKVSFVETRWKRFKQRARARFPQLDGDLFGERGR